MATKKKKSSALGGPFWKKSNVACRRVYGTLIDRQFSVSVGFEDAGKLKLSSLSYFARGSGAIGDRAESFAFWLGHYFINVRRAKLESGISSTKAMASMTSLLKKGNKNLGDFAKVVDETFRFRRES